MLLIGCVGIKNKPMQMLVNLILTGYSDVINSSKIKIK